MAGFEQLQRLSLVDTPITDVGLKQLAGLKQLQFLNLQYTKITDTGLKDMADLKQLQLLSVPDQITSGGLKELRKSLPKCGFLH